MAATANRSLGMDVERWRVNFELHSVQVGKPGTGLGGPRFSTNMWIFLSTLGFVNRILLRFFSRFGGVSQRVPGGSQGITMCLLCWLCPTASQVSRIWQTSLPCCHFNPNLAWSRWRLPWELACPVAEPPSSVLLARPPQPSAFGSLTSLVSTAQPLIHPCSISA